MASPDLAGVEPFNLGLATIPCAVCTRSFSFFSFFSFSFLPFFITSCQSPSSVGAWVLATWAYEGDGPPFPLLGVCSWGGEGAALFSPLASFFGMSPRDAERGLRKIPIFFVAGWDSRLLDFQPDFKEVLMGVEHSPNTSVASFTLSVMWRGVFPAYPVVWCWEPSPVSLFFYFAPSEAEGRPFIPQLQKKPSAPYSTKLFVSNL